MVSVLSLPQRKRARTLARLGALLLIPTGAGAAIAAAPPACDGMLTPAASGNVRRVINIDDLVRLRDIGVREIAPFQSQFGISQDGKRVAFVLHRADPIRNSYCVALAVMDLTAGSHPTIIDEGDDLVLEPWQFRNLFQPNAQGTAQVITPKWAVDGQSIAYLKRYKGVTQVWLAKLDGSAARPVTHSAADVTAFEWTKNNREIIYSSRPALLAQGIQREEEARHGYLYDERFVPNASNRPSLKLPVPYEALVANIETGETRAATPEEVALTSEAGRTPEIVSATGRRSGIAPSDPGNLLSSHQLWTSTTDGQRHACLHSACSAPAFRGFVGLWWDKDNTHLLFMRWEGFGDSQLSLYRWNVISDDLKRVMTTEDLLSGCQMAGPSLLCARDASKAPRRIVKIDPQSGKSTLLYDPNPDFATLDLGTVERLHWTNEFGLPGFGDLVLPPTYRPGQKLPLIIVQYRTTGFLRGGTGDEYPIYLLAAEGYAVLSVDNPPAYYSTVAGVRFHDAYEAQRLNQTNWNERRSVLSSILSGIKIVVDRGIVDPQRIGITGLSDGASTVEFALINSNIFSAAAISTCCFVGKSMMIYGGLAVAEDRRKMGFPSATGADMSAWRLNSLALNADRVKVPLLMQVADNEYITSLEAYTALHDAGQPTELYVFDNEYHNKWQPAHRAAIYRRVLDWFDYWLMGRERTTADTADQYARWAKLKQKSR